MEKKKTPLQVVNDMIIQELFAAKLSDEKLVWQKPYFAYPKQNYLTGYTYNAINKLLLGNDGEEFYLTLKQVNSLEGKVNEFNWRYVYNSFRKTREVDAAYQPKFWETIEVIQGVRYAVVWQHTYTKLIRLRDTDIPVQKTGIAFDVRPDLEDFIESRFPVKVIHGGSLSGYDVPADTIHIPDRDRFSSSAEYYKTLFHEVAHACGTQSRLKRFDAMPTENNQKAFAREELTAELAAATMMHKFGIEFDVKNTAAYIDQWIEAVQADDKLFLNAAANAEKIIKFLGV